LSIKTASVDTEIADRDTHLKSADFFDAEKFPVMTFSSTSMEDFGDDTYELKGLMKIKDVEKPVKLSVEFGGVMKDPWGNEKAGFSITGKLNRKDFGLNWNAALEAGGVLVGEEVKIICDIELAKQA
jgi:polyisoprenoid-binding protein YceI